MERASTASAMRQAATAHEDSQPSESVAPKPGSAWLPLVLLGLAPLAFLRIALRPIADPDAFWHIRAGEYVWQTWSFAGPDPWSQFSEHPWILHEWLPEVAMAAAARAGGLPAVAWLNWLVILVLFVVTYAVCRRGADRMPAAIATTAALFGASASFTPRPQMWSFVFLACVLGAWLRTLEDGRPRYWIIPLQWIWACSHGLWFVGIGVGVVVVLGMVVDGRTRGPRHVAGLAMVPLLSLVASGLTPVGPTLLLAPLMVGDTTHLVSEWSPASLTQPGFALTMACAGFVVFTWARRRGPVPWTHLLLWAVAVCCALMYARTVALGAIILAPLVAMALQSFHPDTREISSRSEKLTILATFVVGLLIAALALPGLASRPAMPDGLDPQLSALPTGTVVYDEYSLGGWLRWRHPHLALVVDPRTEVYSTGYLDSYVDSLGAAPGWDATVERSGATYALLPASLALTDALRRASWTEVGRDRDVVLLHRDVPAAGQNPQ